MFLSRLNEIKDKILYFFIGGFVGGIFFKSLLVNKFLGKDFYFSLMFILLAVIFLFYFLFFKKTIRFFLLLILFLGLGLGMLRFDFSNFLKQKNNLDYLVDQKVEIEGIVVEPIDERATNNHLVVGIKKINKEVKNFKRAKILIITKTTEYFDYGDEIKIKGNLKVIENFIGDNEKEFNYIQYLAKDKIFYQVFYPVVELIKKNDNFSIRSSLFNLRKFFITNLNKNMAQPESFLMSGILFGTTGFSDQWQEKFVRSGLIHIVALSGYNITIVAESLIKFFSFLPLFLKSFLGFLGIILFVIMTGASATAVRAAIMAGLVLLARIRGRDYNIKRAIFFAGFLMVLHNPKILFFDPSFQLSFLATLGLIYLTPFFERKLSFITEKLQLRSIIASTIAVQIFVYPFIIYQMGKISLVALPANILVLSFIPLIMFLGFLVATFGFISLFILPLSLFAYTLLHYILKITDFFASFSWAMFSLKNFPWYLMVLIYLIIFYFVYRININSEIECKNKKSVSEKY